LRAEKGRKDKNEIVSGTPKGGVAPVSNQSSLLPDTGVAETVSFIQSDTEFYGVTDNLAIEPNTTFWKRVFMNKIKLSCVSLCFFFHTSDLARCSLHTKFFFPFPLDARRTGKDKVAEAR
jgi:hypothetical protein